MQAFRQGQEALTTMYVKQNMDKVAATGNLLMFQNSIWAALVHQEGVIGPTNIQFCVTVRENQSFESISTLKTFLF